MSVVAGCSLFDGVLLAADCRATIRMHNKPDIHSDNVLKIFALLPHTALGFVGDIDVASYLLQNLLIGLDKQRRKDPISLSLWIPRLFRNHYNRFTSKNGNRTVVFMIGSILRDRNNIVERKAVVELVKYICFGNSPIKRNWIPDFLMKILKVPEKYKWIEIPNTCRNLLYTIASPNFEIRSYSPLQFTAIGSGESCLEQIDYYKDAIFAWDTGNSFVESSQFRQIIQNFIDEKGIKSVGGLYPVLKVSGKGVEHIGMGAEIPVGGTRIELSFQSNRWIQRNVTEKKELPIIMPWEFMKLKGFQNQTFNDLSDAFRGFLG
ncbi:MAG TPA: hypothetical protein ACFYD4_05830 [Candidatus Wunengus sp. YC61]|uniref:hypothetical protein n=1 Tax=Candidatus Wunengus sp. YC61 TaxID=3367698 RepID=UPI004029A17D